MPFRSQLGSRLKKARVTLCGPVLLVGVCSASPSGDEFLHPTASRLDASDRASVEQLLRELRDAQPFVRNRAVRRIEAIGAAAGPGLRAQVEAGGDPLRTRMSALALGALADPPSLHTLREVVLDGRASGDRLRGALIGLSRESRPASGLVAERLRELSFGGASNEVAHLAVLVAATRDVLGLPAELAKVLRRERRARATSAWLLALAEGPEQIPPDVVARALETQRTRPRAAALYAAARSADPSLLKPLLRTRASNDAELMDRCVALGAFPTAAALAELERLLTREPDACAVAVYSVAALGLPSARELLDRALDGDFGVKAQGEACLAVTRRVDRRNFLERLRPLATDPDPQLRSRALLALARLGDAQLVEELSARLAGWADEETLALAVLVCLGDAAPGFWKVIPESRRRGEVGRLCALAASIDEGRLDGRRRDDEVRRRLRQANAHWELQRDALRQRALEHALGLDELILDGLGLDGDERGEGQEGGSDDEVAPPSGGRPGLGGVSRGGAVDPGRSRKGQRQTIDRTRFEADLLFWFRHYPLFDLSEPFRD